MYFKLRIIFLFYLAFVIYGSLVPLEYVYVPFEQARDQFLNIRFLNLGILSRADWVANGLLFIPLTFFLLASFWRRNSLFFNSSLVLFSLLLSVFLPLGIEFTQLYFPNRTVSQNDIMAEAIGGVIGIITWFILKNKFIIFATQLFDKSFKDKWRSYLIVYLCCMFSYSVMPLDLTLSPIELYRKWDNGLLNFMPFQFIEKELFFIIYDIITDILLWVPVTFFLIKTESFDTKQIYLRIFFSAFIIEFCQLFVFSRYTDINDIFTALLGAYVGIKIFKKWPVKNSEKKKFENNYLQYIVWLGFLAWLIILVLIYWYPFNFNISNNHITLSLKTFFSVPFASYYIGSEFLAITQLFRKLLFAMPLGVFLFFILLTIPKLSNALKWFIIIFVLFSILFGFELIQMLIPERTANLTDVCISFFGALLGYYGIQQGGIGKYQDSEKLIFNKHENNKTSYFYQTLYTSNHQNNSHSLNQESKERIEKLTVNYTYNKKLWISFVGLHITIFILLVNSIGQIDKIPYDIREITAEANVFQLLLLWLALVVAMVLPLVLAHKESNSSAYLTLLTYPLLSFFSVFIFFLLFFSVPMESIHDIIGFPILDWPWQWESIGRFSFLYAGVVWCMLGSYFLIEEGDNRKIKFYRWLLLSMLIVPISHYVIVTQAATDNLTELMRNNGNWLSSFFIFLFLFNFFYTTNLIGSFISRAQQLKPSSIIFIFISIPISYFFANNAAEDLIVKYGQVFSAMQFLLSPDRKNYLSPDVIYIYYLVAYIVALLSIVWFQMIYWFKLRLNIKLNSIGL